jgi:hypothetical protein
MWNDQKLYTLDCLSDADTILTGMQDIIQRAFDPATLPEDPANREKVSSYGAFLRRQAKMALDIVKEAKERLMQ